MDKQTIISKTKDYFKTKPVLKAWLFGSYARGEETDNSDVDILVLLDYSQPVGLAFFGMFEEIKELLGLDVDLVSERSLTSFARSSVNRDKVLIYERAD